MDNPQGNTVSEVRASTARETFFLPLSLKPLDDPKFDPGESIVMDAETGHISTISNREFAEVAVRAVNAHDEMLAALRNVNKLVSEAAMTGFNCHDGDWAERLFASQQVTHAAIAKATGTTDTHRDSVNEQRAGREDS